MERNLLKAFWNCGDNQYIEFAILRARLNKIEKDVVHLTMDECMTQEQIAEELDFSCRKIQEAWYSAERKLLSIPWVSAYAKELSSH